MFFFSVNNFMSLCGRQLTGDVNGERGRRQRLAKFVTHGGLGHGTGGSHPHVYSLCLLPFGTAHLSYV